MPSIYQFKPAFQATLRPLVRRLAAAHVTPNEVTVTALLLSLAVGAAILFHPTPAVLLLLPPVLLLRMALNAIDGMLAREHGPVTALGGMLNEIGDVVSDIALYLPLALLPGIAPLPLVLSLLFAVTAEVAGLAAATAGASRRYDGPFGKSDRAFAFGALGLALGFGVPAGHWVDLLLWTLTAAALLTVVNRCRGALGEIEAPQNSQGAQR